VLSEGVVGESGESMEEDEVVGVRRTESEVDRLVYTRVVRATTATSATMRSNSTATSSWTPACEESVEASSQHLSLCCSPFSADISSTVCRLRLQYDSRKLLAAAVYGWSSLTDRDS